MSKNDLSGDLSPENESGASPDTREDSLAEDAVSERLEADEQPHDGLTDEERALELEFGPSNEDEPIEKPVDSYFDDDENWDELSDTIIHQDEFSVVAQQNEAVVKWNIEGLYDEDGKVRGKRSLRNNPPLFVVSDSNGEEATFVLTKELSGVLANHFENAHRAYYGIRPRDEMSFREKLGEAKTGIKNNMGKAIIIGGLLVGLLIFGLVF